MANKMIKILGDRLSVFYNWHTTVKLLDEVRKEAVERDVSLNSMLNTIIYERYFKSKTTK